jgi:electron transfer flavoprotein beta subunit
MNVVVLVKQVPDTSQERALSGSTHTLDREASDLVLGVY